MAASKELTLFEAASIVAGYGIGAGVMAVPWMVASAGVWTSLVVIAAASGVSVLLHLMIAEVALGSAASSRGVQVVEMFRAYLFRGRMGGAITWTLFGVVLLSFSLNLAAYVAGAGDIVSSLTGLSPITGSALFALLAAGVAVLGLKALGVSEKIAVVALVALFAVLAAGTMTAPSRPLPLSFSWDRRALALFGVVMFCLASFFAIPQVVEGLRARARLVRGAVLLGLSINLAVVVLLSLLALVASDEVTPVAIVGWAQAVGRWVAIVGSLFFLLALLTTYWSLSFALGTIVRERLPIGRLPACLVATVPNIALALTGLTGFVGFVRLAGGLIALLVALLFVPAYLAHRHEAQGRPLQVMTGALAWQAWAWIAMAGYLLMAAGSIVAL